ncbi:hypothetical protein ACHAWC_002807 [Mediolabrus comicus]
MEQRLMRFGVLMKMYWKKF